MSLYVPATTLRLAQEQQRRARGSACDGARRPPGAHRCARVAYTDGSRARFLCLGWAPARFEARPDTRPYRLACLQCGRGTRGEVLTGTGRGPRGEGWEEGEVLSPEFGNTPQGESGAVSPVYTLWVWAAYALSREKSSGEQRTAALPRKLPLQSGRQSQSKSLFFTFVGIGRRTVTLFTKDCEEERVALNQDGSVETRYPRIV